MLLDSPNALDTLAQRIEEVSSLINSINILNNIQVDIVQDVDCEHHNWWPNSAIDQKYRHKSAFSDYEHPNGSTKSVKSSPDALGYGIKLTLNGKNMDEDIHEDYNPDFQNGPYTFSVSGDIEEHAYELDAPQTIQTGLHQPEQTVMPWNFVKNLLINLESELRNSDLKIPKRDKLLNCFIKSLKEFLRRDFLDFTPDYDLCDNQTKVKNYKKWLTAYACKLLGEERYAEMSNENYYGDWSIIEFTLGSFICKNTMKQMITSSREKAYFYGLQKCLKNWSQKKLAIVLKNPWLAEILGFMFENHLVLSLFKSESLDCDSSS